MKGKIIVIDIAAMIKGTLHTGLQRSTGTPVTSPASCSTPPRFRGQTLPSTLHCLRREIKVEGRLGVGKGLINT